MSGLTVALCLVAGWVLLITFLNVVVAPWLRRGPGGHLVLGLLWRLVRMYIRLWHRARFEGLEHLPAGDDDHDGLIIVANHTGAVDPLLIQGSAPFLITWMMARETMLPSLDWLWQHLSLIPVERTGRDAGAAREAIRTVRAGGCVGIFPEGRIVQPSGEIRPFVEGVGLIVRSTEAPVLCAGISGTPPTADLFAAIRRPSRARVVFSEPMKFSRADDAAAITEALRARLAELSGWPLVDEPLPPHEPPSDPFAS